MYYDVVNWCFDIFDISLEYFSLNKGQLDKKKGAVKWMKFQ